MVQNRRNSMAMAGLVDQQDNDDNLQTILRVRGMPGIDIYDDSYVEVVSDPGVNQAKLVLKNEIENQAQVFKFDRILQPEDTQVDTFKASSESLLKMALQGKNTCAFTYGSSGSGKTYTIMGGQGDQAGVLPRTVSALFNCLDEKLDNDTKIVPSGTSGVKWGTPSELRDATKTKSELMKLSKQKVTSKRRSILEVDDALKDDLLDHKIEDFEAPAGKYILFVSFVELYNEDCFDLLKAPSMIGKREKLTIRQDGQGWYVDKTRYVRVDTPKEALKLIEVGRRNLTTAQTKLNNDSSRSHCIFSIKIARSIGKSKWVTSSLAFCDLAGVERRKKMGKFGSIRSDESKTINQSLMQLRIVIRELQQQQSRPNSVAVGFRNSKLTKIMQNYLTGNSATRIIIAISNDPRFREETSSSLEFASTAATINMGRDRRGNRTRSLLNISEVPTDQDEQVSSDTDRGTPDTLGGAQSLAQIPYEHWSKDDLIADLRYYVEHHEIDQENIQRLKNGWKEDEYNYNRDYKMWEKERKNNQIDLYNLRIIKHNEMEVMVCDFLAQKKVLREKIKQLQAVGGQPDGQLDGQMADLQATISKLESDLAASQIEVSDLKEQNRASESNTESFRKELEMANLKLNERNDAHRKYDEDLRAYKAQIEEKEKLISHLKDSYEDVHDNLTAMQSEKQNLEQKLAQREHDLENLQEQMLEHKRSLEEQLIKTPLGNETLELFTLTPAKTCQSSRKSCGPEHSTFQYPALDPSALKDQQHLEELQHERDNAISELEDQKEQSRLQDMKIEDQQTKISQLESTISRGRVALKDSNERSEQAQLKIQQLTSTIEDLNTNICQLEEEKIAALASSSKFQLALTEKANLIEDLKNQIEEFEFKIEEQRTLSEEGEEVKNQLRSQIETLRLQASQSTMNSNEVVEAQNEEIRKLKSELISRVTEVEILNQKIEKMSAERDELAKNLDDKRDEVLKTSVALQEKSSNLIELENSIKDQRRKVEAQTSMLEKGKEEIEELIQKSNNQSAQIEELEKIKNELQKERERLERDFEESEENAELMKSENDELRDQLRDVHNGTERREVEERCHGLINDLDELTKEKVSISKEKLKVEEKHKEEQTRNKALEDQLKELSQKFNHMELQSVKSSEPSEDQKKYIEKLEAECEDLRGKFDRSLLRKQKEKALRMLDEEKSKVAKLEQMLANKENQVGQLESVLAQNNSDALDSLIVQSGSKPPTKVKEEPKDFDTEIEQPPAVQIKPEPIFEELDNVLPKPIPTKAGRPKRVKKLAPESPEPLSNTPSQENIRPRRNLRNRK